jgi:hypothetical protein
MRTRSGIKSILILGRAACVKFAAAAAIMLLLASCAVGPRTPVALPAPAHASERVGPWDITIALYNPVVFGPERSLVELVKEYRLTLEKGKIKNAKLLVNKAQRRLELWVHRRMVKAYRIQLGLNPHGPKMHLGDRRTPEGEYFICVHTPSQFYLALWISYPNTEDARRGLKEGLITPKDFEDTAAALKEGQCPPQNTKLGGDLLIHGQPPEYASELAQSQRKSLGARRSGLLAGDPNPAEVLEYQDWTDGCVALFNPDIRELYDFIADGTPLRIIASGPVTPPPAVLPTKGQK